MKQVDLLKTGDFKKKGINDPTEIDRVNRKFRNKD
jgi:hypothetical protein